MTNTHCNPVQWQTLITDMLFGQAKEVICSATLRRRVRRTDVYNYEPSQLCPYTLQGLFFDGLKGVVVRLSLNYIYLLHCSTAIYCIVVRGLN